MPIYEYVCVDCRTKFDELRSIDQADTVIECEQCGSTHTQRMLSVFAIKGGDGAALMPSMGSGAGCACGGSCACGGH